MADQLKLYNYYRSSASFRVRIALNLKHLKFEYISVHLLRDGGEQYKPEYKSVNPLSQVPTLVDGKHVITQSMAIIQYLDKLHPSPRLFPESALDHARILQFCEIINSGIQPLQNSATTKYLETKYSITDEQRAEWYKHWMKKGYGALEEFLTNHSGTYCYGDSLTAADCFLVPQVFSSIRFGFDPAPYKNVMRVYKHASELEAFILASPAKQMDAN